MGEIANPGLAGLGERARAGAAEFEARVFSGSLRDLAAHVPEFAREPLAAGADENGCEQPHLDVVVRRAGACGQPGDVPVGVVSRRYQLVPHSSVIQALQHALRVTNVDLLGACGELELTDFGASMILALDLPGSFDPGDGAPLKLRLLCHNKVSGGGLRMLAAWHRSASDSAIPVGTTRLEYRLAHRLPARLADIVPAVQRAMQCTAPEHRELVAWRQRLVTRDRIVAWADGSIRRMWGPRAAARVFHIAMSGWDANPAFGFERVQPSRRTMSVTRRVPAAPDFVETAYDALLALAWVARDARNAQERFDRLVELAVLMRALLHGGAGK